MGDENESQKRILKSTGIVGGAQVFSILIGIIRTKVIAILLGPMGVGVIGILQSTVDLIRNITSFGISFSGVKDIAEAAASEDQKQIAKTITIVRRWALGTGLFGMLITIALCVPLSKYSFGNDGYALSIAIISITLFFTSVSAGQIALLQGLRQIGQMAKATIYGAFLSTSITLPLYWWFGIRGIVPGMILTSFVSLFVSWLFARKIKVEKPIISFTDTFKGGWNMARLGFFMVISGFVASATLYIVRAFIVTKMSLIEVGYFQSAWMIANVYINIVLNAMLADFFPRLSAINRDNTASNKLINEQLEMALIVGSPMIISLIAFAGIVIQILYSSKFAMAIPIMRWQIAGSFFVLISWPLGVQFLAKNKGFYSIIINVVWSVIYFLSIYFGWDFFGFKILGIAYFFASICQLIVIFGGVRSLNRFNLSDLNFIYIIIFGCAILLTMLNVLYISGNIQYLVSGIILTIVFVYSYTQLRKIIDIKIILNFFRKRQ